MRGMGVMEADERDGCVKSSEEAERDGSDGGV